MGSTIFYLLMLQKYINSKQNSFLADNIFKKTGLNGWVYDFFVDYRASDTSNIIDIHKYLMKKRDIK